MMVMLVAFDPSHDRHLVRALHAGSRMVVCGLLDGAADVLTWLDVELAQQFPMPILMVGDGTRVLSHAPHTWEVFYSLVDACCGLGSLPLGALAVGMLTMVAADSNARMVEFHRVHGSCEYVTGDIDCSQVIAQVWAMDIRWVDAGCPMTVVSKVEVFESRHERHLLGMVHNGAIMVFRRLLDGGSGVVMLLDTIVVTQYLIPVLTTGPDTTVLHLSSPSWNNYVKLIDVCCGQDGMTHGDVAVGVYTTVANYRNAKMNGLLTAHSGRDHVPGEAGYLQVEAEIWRRGDLAANMSADCSCQLCPFGCCDVARSVAP